MTHKRNRWKHLVTYISQSQDANSELFPPYLHNMSYSDVPAELADQFIKNDAYRPNRRKVITYHEVLSFAPADKQMLLKNPGIIQAITKKYIEIRCPNAMVLTQPHITDNIHIHFLISATGCRSSENQRQSRADFRETRKRIESYQIEQYPELKSLVYQNWNERRSQLKEDVNTRKERERQMLLRGGKTVLRNHVRDILVTLGAGLNSAEELFQAIEAHPELDIYRYRERVNGVIFAGRKFRFRTLKVLPNLTQYPERLRTIDDHITTRKAKHRSRKKYL